MLNLGFFELLLFAIIALIVLGPEQLIAGARTLGRWYGKLRRITTRLQSEFVSELQLTELHNELKGEIAKIRASEHELKSQMQQLQHTLQGSAQSLSSNTPDPRPPTPDVAPVTTMPLTGRFFLLGDYDRTRRLPRAPFLPNHRPDPLLYQRQSIADTP